MKKLVFLTILIAIGNILSYAQRIVVNSNIDHIGSVPKADYVDFGNNVQAAKIIIELNVPDVLIENPEVILGNVEKETGRYEFFAKINKNKKKNYVNLNDGNGNKLKLNLLDVNGNNLVGGEAYQVKMERLHDENGQRGGIEILSFPVGAKVFIDGVEIGETSNEPLEEMIYANEKHTITFRKDGYMDTDTIISIKQDDMTPIAVSLKERMSKYRIKTDVSGATARIDGHEMIELPNKGILNYGLHRITATAQYKLRNNMLRNYNTRSVEVVADDNNSNIEKTINFTGSANISVNSGVKGRRVKIELKPITTSDTTKLVYETHHGAPNTSHTFNGLYGVYKVTMKSEMSDTKEDVINVGSGQSITRSYVLSNSGIGKTIFALRSSFRAPIGASISYVPSKWGVAGIYVAGGGTFAVKDKPSDMGSGEHRSAEYYVFGIRSGYGVFGVIYNPNSWLYFNIGGGYGEYESAGYRLVGRDNEQKPTEFDKCENFRGGAAEIGIAFTIRKLYFGFGYNMLIGKEMTPFKTNPYVSLGIKI